MIKPGRLRPGDEVAVVSLSKGMLGEKKYIHILDIARQRLERDYGLSVVVMPNALKGVEYLYRHPEARAADLMDAFRRPSVRAIICAIGGDDTLRLLPYVDFEVIRSHPKIFMGFSDTTVNHLMMYKAGLVSYYGGSLMNNWGEYGAIHPYTESALRRAFFEPTERFEIRPAGVQCFDDDDQPDWCPENAGIPRKTTPDPQGYEVLQGAGRVSGRLLGGCIETFSYLMGTSLWPTLEQWRDKILFIETSDNHSETDFSQDLCRWVLRSLAVQGVFRVVRGVIMGKPPLRAKYDSYRQILLDAVATEAARPDLPLIYNVNFGHAYPIGIIPYGLMCELDCGQKSITVTESLTV